MIGSKRKRMTKMPMCMGLPSHQARQAQPALPGGAQHRRTASELLKHPGLAWAEITLRPNERGHLHAHFGRCRVWLVHQGECRQEWLLIRQADNPFGNDGLAQISSLLCGTQ